MPFKVTRLDYAVTIMFMIVFEWSFFFYPNLQIYLASLILVYEMFQIYVLPGKPRLREIDKRLVIFKIRLAIRNKLQEGVDEYHQWRKKR